MNELLQLVAGRRGHFRMESGYHSEQWFELGRLFDDPARLRPFVAQLASRLARFRIDAVCGPKTGGAKLADMLAAELGCTSLWSERYEPAEGSGLFQVQYRLPDELRSQVGERSIAVVDDAISAGSAMRATVADLEACRARPVVLGALFVFGDAAARYASERGLALEGLVHTSFAMWRPEECPLCRAGVALERVSDVTV